MISAVIWATICMSFVAYTWYKAGKNHSKTKLGQNSLIEWYVEYRFRGESEFNMTSASVDRLKVYQDASRLADDNDINEVRVIKRIIEYEYGWIRRG